MAFSQEIRFKIGADTTELKKGMASVGAVAQATGKNIDDVMKGSFAQAKKLADFRDKNAYKEANTIGKIKMVTADIARSIKDRNKFEEGTSQYLERQLAIEQKIVNLRGLQRKAQLDNGSEVGMTSVGGASKEGGMFSGAFGSASKGLASRVMWTAAGGIISSLVSAIPRYFKREAQKAMETLDVTESTSASRREGDIAMGGLTAKSKSGASRASAIQQTMESLQKDLDSLTKTPQGAVLEFLSEEAAQGAAIIRGKLNDLKKEYTAVGVEVEVTNQQIKMLNTSFDIQEQHQKDIDNLQKSGGASSLALTKAKLDAEVKYASFLDAEVKKGKAKAEDSREAWLKVGETMNARDALVQQMKQRRLDVVQDITADAAGGRTFSNGVRRPRSETERLAQQAQAARTRMRNSILTEAAGEASFQQIRARGLEDSVSERLSRASALIAAPQGTDLSALAGKIENTNSLLRSIDNSLGNKTVE